MSHPSSALDTITAEPTAQATGITIHMAPPFDGWQAFRSPTPNGFWSAVRIDAVRGDLVLQLGRQGGGSSPFRVGRLRAGWRRRVQLWPGNYVEARIDPGRLSLFPRGGFVIPTATLELRRLRDDHIREQTVRLQSHTPVVLGVEPPSSDEYELTVRAELRAGYRGTASPYGEILAQVSRVDREIFVDPMASAPGDAPGDEMLKEEEEALKSAEAYLIQEVGSVEEAVAAGLQSLAD